jgi:hypothetical protein
MTHMNSRREGFALAATVLAMMVVGAIVTGGFYAASQESSIARSTDAGELALYVAETGLNNTIGTATGGTISAQTIGSPNTGSPVSVSYGGTTVGNYQVTITRIAPLLYVVRSTGTVTLAGPYSGSSHSVAAVVRVRNVDFDNDTAVQVYGDLTVGGNSDVNGNDWYYTNWTSCTTKTGTDAVTANPGSSINTNGSGQITGTVDQNATLTAANFTVFGDMTFNDVAALADYRFTANTTVNPQPQYTGSPTTCYTSVSTKDNWGHPTSTTDVCRNWFPIIEAQSDLNVQSANTGQGILLVRGDLDIQGGFTFYGVVVVLGEIRIAGTGGHINGTLIAYGQGDLNSSNSTLGNSLVQYSSCGIERAVAGNSKLARTTPIANRSWMDVSNIQNSY